MRLDWFLPGLRKSSDDVPRFSAWWYRTLRRTVPRTLTSDHVQKRRGLVRRGLRWLGSSWMQSPLRRLAQATCLVLFLWLFFYVCWPYSATPVPAARSVSAWQLVQLDQTTGQLDLRRESIPVWLRQARTVILNDSSSDSRLADYQVVAVQGDTLSLLPDGQATEAIHQVLLASGQWSIREATAGDWPTHYADDLARKEHLPADLMLALDPLVSLSTAVASRQWVWSLSFAAAILLVCVVIPRGFCGYVCPLGTLIDLFDWAVGSRIKRFRVSGSGWWVHIKYYLLFGSLVASACGVLVTGYVAAIPVVTRGLLFSLEPVQSGVMRGWHLVPLPTTGALVSVGLFLGIFLLGFFQPRFWCKYVCPSGAVFSLGNLLRASERKVEASCIHCNRCIEVCPFDAIKPDFTTRVTDCTLCQTCGGACPVHAIKFVERGNQVELKVENDPPTHETKWGRRGFLSACMGSTAAVAGGGLMTIATKSFGARLSEADWVPVRPPGSVPESTFLELCIRCGECFKACPNNVLQPLSFEQGLEGLWTPHVVADWAGCESSCNNCGQVCPTGAIRALSMDEKRHARMGLAIVNLETCLPFANREACQLCVDECNAAGYEAIEFVQVHTDVDETGEPIEGSGYLAPEVIAEKCVGCGLCQTRCYGINVEHRGVLAASAIVIQAGEGREDRLARGSYQAAAEKRSSRESQPLAPRSDEFYVPPVEDSEDESPDSDAPQEDDPFF